MDFQTLYQGISKKRKTDKLVFIKLKPFVPPRTPSRKLKRKKPPIEYEKIFANHKSDERLVKKIHKRPASTWKGAQHHQPPWKCNSQPQDTNAYPLGWL